MSSSNDGIRVTSSTFVPPPRRLSSTIAEKLFDDINKKGEVTEEFAPNAFDTVESSRVRPKTNAKHRDLLRKELEQSNQQIAKLEAELEEQDFSTTDTISKLTSLNEYQERAIQFRQMHLDTALDEAAELEEKVKQQEKRIKDVRSKALTRKFQSRFWMMLFITSMLEHLVEGSLMWLLTKVIMPVTSDLVFSNTRVAVVMRTMFVLGGAVYMRVDKMFGRVPALV